MRTPSSDGYEVLFQPDLVLPLQFFAGRKQKDRGNERQLFLAILQDAVECFQKYLYARDVRNRRIWIEAEEWFLSDDQSWPFSFISVCEVLEIDPQALRRGLMTWKERSLGSQSANVPRGETEPTRKPGRRRQRAVVGS